MNDINTLKETSLLDDNSLESLSMISSELERGADNIIMFRPRYLMEVSVLDDVSHPTIDAKYWQCNLERDVQYKNLILLSYDYKEKNIDIAIKEDAHNQFDLSDHTQMLKAEKYKIQIERMKAEKYMMWKEGEDRVREIIEWTDIMSQFKPDLEFSADNPEDHMAKSYPLRFARQKELAERSGCGDMNGYINIAGLAQTAFKNPDTLALMEKETVMIN